MVLLLAIWLLAPGIIGLLSSNLPTAVVTALGASFLLAQRIDWPARFALTAALFLTAIPVNVVLFFAGCVILLNWHH